MLEEFLRYLAAERRCSPLTVRNYRRDLTAFFAWLGADPETFDPSRIGAEDLRGWMLHRTETARLSAGSVNRELSSIRSFLHWLRRTGRTQRDVGLEVASLRAPKRLPVFVPESRMQPIVAECSGAAGSFTGERNALVVLLLYTCGLRLAELVGIDRDDFADDFRSLRVRGKGGKMRVVPLLEFVRERVLGHIGRIDREKICRSGEKALFLSLKGERISRSTVQRIVKSELTHGGVQGRKSPHVLRHTFATHLLDGGADMRDIEELLGHASLQATQVYTHNSIAALREAYAEAHPRGKRAEKSLTYNSTKS